MAVQSNLQRKLSYLPWPLIGLAGLCFTLLLFLLQLPFFFSPGWLKTGANLLEHLYILIWLLVVTAFNRTVSLRTLLAFGFMGLYLIVTLAVLTGWPVAALLGENSQFLSSIWAPLTEELLKALPVALYFWLATRSRRWQPAATDGLLLGFVVGAGFAFYEDTLDLRVSGSGWLASGWSIFWPVLTSSGSIFQSSRVNLGHAGWTALVGLALGLAFLYRRYRYAWLAPLLALGLVMLDHGLGNYMGDLGRHAAPLLLDLLYTLLLRGRLVVVILLIGIVVTIVLEQRMLRWASARDRFFPAIPLSTLQHELFRPLNWPQLYHLQETFEYLRRRRAAYYTLWLWRDKGVEADQGAEMAATLFTLGVNAGLPLK